MRADFKDLHGLTDNSVTEINLMSYVCRWTTLGEKLVQLTLTAFYFKFTQGHTVFLIIRCILHSVVAT